MEPVSLVATFAARAAGGISASVLGRMLMTKRWANRVASKALKKVERPRPGRTLTRWLREPSTWEMLVSPRQPGREAVASLNHEFLANSSKRIQRKWASLDASEQERRTERILAAVYDLVLTQHEYRWSNRIASERGLSATQEIGEQIAHVSRQLTESNQTTFDSHLAQLPSSCRSIFQKAWETDRAPAATVVRLLTDPDTLPATTIQTWTKSTPAWFLEISTPYLFDALGECAIGYGEAEFAATCFQKALDLGAPNSSYLRARLAYIQHLGLGRTTQARDTMGSDVPEDPFEAFIYLYIRGESAPACAIIDKVSPSRESDHAFKALHGLECRFAQLDAWTEADLTAAIDLLTGAISETRAASLLLKRAELLRVRAVRFPRGNHETDGRAALVDAVGAREVRREFRGDSAEATVHLFDLALQLGQPQRVIDGFRGVDHEFSCTAIEAQNNAVRAKVAMAAFGVEDSDLLNELAATLKDGFTRSRIEAYASEIAGAPDIEERWLQALALAGDESERVQALAALARIGATELPGLDELATEQPDAGVEIRASWAAARGDHNLAVELLRPRRRSSFTAAMQLSIAYEKLGRPQDGARTLFDAADDFSDPSLRHQGCVVLARAGFLTEARGAIESHLQLCPPDWNGYSESLALAAQICIDANDLEAARPFFKAYVERRPDDPTRVIIYLRLLTRIGDHEGAIDFFNQQGAEFSVSDVDDAHLWLNVAQGARVDPAITAARGLAFLDRFGRSEELCAHVIVTFLTSRSAEETDISDELLARMRDETTNFTERWPQSRYLRSVSIDPTKDIVKQLADLTQEDAELVHLRTRMFDQLSKGYMPLGAATTFIRASYAEALVRRLSDTVPASSLNAGDELRCESVFARTRDRDVVIDLSAMISLANLSPEMRRNLLNSFRRVLIPRDSVDDIHATRDRDATSEGFLYFDAHVGAPRITEHSANERRRTAAELAIIGAILDDLHIEARPTYRVARDFEVVGDDGWLAASDLAASRELTLWCDDSAMRAQLQILGVNSFSTFSALAQMQKRGVITSQQQSDSTQELFAHRIGDLDFSSGFALEHLERNSWEIGAISAALRRGVQWLGRSQTFRVYYSLLREARGRADEAYVGLAVSAAIGLSSSVFIKSDAVQAVAVSVSAAILQAPERLVSSLFYTCSEALERSWVMQEGEGNTTDSALLIGVVRIVRDAVRAFAPAEAVPTYVIGLFSGLTMPDRGIVARELLVGE